MTFAKQQSLRLHSSELLHTGRVSEKSEGERVSNPVGTTQENVERKE